MKKKLVSSIILSLAAVLVCAVPALADSRKVVTLGTDLSQDQKDTMMRYFGVTYDSVDVIYINNTDERNHLGSYVPLEQIGNYTYSCALVAPTSSGGIQVKTANLEWVTCNMIASTLSTSGVTNCQVVAACPFKVSGTGALTGVIMAYEQASKQSLDPVKVELANQELVTTGNLANEVGQSKATAVINETKIQVIENNVTNIEEITNIVNEVSNNYDVTINDDQSEEIAELMQQIAQQEYDIIQLQATLERVQANVAGDAGASEEEQQQAEERAQEAEAAAEEAAKQQESEAQETEAGGDVVIVDDVTDLDNDNILNNTDPSVLESDGGTVSEEDTTQTVQEQSEQQEQTENEFGIPEATDDGTIQLETQAASENADGSVEDPVFTDDTNAAEAGGEALPEDGTGSSDAVIPSEETESTAGTEAAAPETEAAAETEAAVQETEEVLTADSLNAEDREIYDAVKKDLESAFQSTTITSEDGMSQVYLTETAAKLFPEKIEQYLLKVLTKGADAVAAEEAADTSISQTIVADTQAQAPDKSYEDSDMVQLDKYVRRLIFKDSEEFLADSNLEDADEVVLYNLIMGILEDAYKVEDAADMTEAAMEETAAAPEEGAADAAETSADVNVDEILESIDGEMSDEFADFEEEMGNF
ncbi:DUF1002 domain-containing protein [Marvinbryantia formatexigens]|nr:DUF1002 domain-containing protein [Marvinbryantia formatexigens]UWO26225.1 DUF1002 domain-containing protein [Marvinbryantia formatexigens DSM 14469]SDG11884.1 Uncharacterized protein YpuA, DUF1002 family [Marvinbryantia formatexigens]